MTSLGSPLAGSGAGLAPAGLPPTAARRTLSQAPSPDTAIDITPGPLVCGRPTRS